mgnify:CR=1 FL=1
MARVAPDVLDDPVDDEYDDADFASPLANNRPSSPAVGVGVGAGLMVMGGSMVGGLGNLAAATGANRVVGGVANAARGAASATGVTSVVGGVANAARGAASVAGSVASKAALPLPGALTDMAAMGATLTGGALHLLSKKNSPATGNGHGIVGGNAGTRAKVFGASSPDGVLRSPHKDVDDTGLVDVVEFGSVE